jgi:hypothetical protein
MGSPQQMQMSGDIWMEDGAPGPDGNRKLPPIIHR